jgi:hypothetical protein
MPQPPIARPHRDVLLPPAEGAESSSLLLGQSAAGLTVWGIRSEPESWGLVVGGPGLWLSQARPIRVETYRGENELKVHACGYRMLEVVPKGFLATGELVLHGSARFRIEDEWRIRSNILELSRHLRVAGDAPGGFLSAFSLFANDPMTWTDISAFAPGMLYGDSECLPAAAIGGTANYLQGVREIRIREDRLPAPLFGINFRNGSSVSLLHAHPQGNTFQTDAQDVEGIALIDERLGFGALGGFEQQERVGLGFWYPGSEGEVTYRGDTFPGGQLRAWRRRYHPICDGLTQTYALHMRFGRDERFQETVRSAWHWAWQVLEPQLVPHDLERVRLAATEVLAATVRQREDRAGIPIALESTTGEPDGRHTPRALMGFCGRNIEAAYFLLRAAERGGDETAQRYRRLGLAILASFSRLPTAPPLGEGFNIDTGNPAVHTHNRIYVRTLAEGGKYMLRAWKLEHEQGREHLEWLRWATSLGAWLRSHVLPDGGFPRSFGMGPDGTPDPSAEATYELVPFFVLLAQLTGDDGYLDVALRAGEVAWLRGQHRGCFVGGTIDNPNVIDKEAGTLSLEAYISLFEATGEARWLRRAVAAADFSETWIYLWNVPMPDEADDASLAWSRGVSTVGVQLIASGHSLVDHYMAWDVALYAKLYTYTGDRHYREVTQLLLHNTKAMLALPGRTFGLAGPGWQQEHWSLAPYRGRGIHRLWLPWLACSHLEGIYALEDFDHQLYQQLAAAGTLYPEF